jgi:hypothetical protein
METATLDSFEMTEYERWTPGIDNDAHLVLRETPPWVVRERWAQIKLRVHEMNLQHELDLAHITENLDHSLDQPVLPTVEEKKAGSLLDNLSVHMCRFMHRAPTFRKGDQFSVCPTCKRKYAVPYADETKLPAGTYVYNHAKSFPTSAKPISQALCRNGLQGVS